MLALTSVWIGMAAFVLSAAMVVYRPVFTDLTVTLVLYFGSPGSLCLAGLVLWAYRKEDRTDPGVSGQRKQAQVAIALSLVAAAVVYALVIFSHKLESVDHQASIAYHSTPEGAFVVDEVLKYHADNTKWQAGNS